MDTLNLEQVESLFGRQPGWCVSLYLPTHRAGPEIRKDPIRLKNRISEAESQLETAGVSAPEIRQLIEPVRSLCHLDTEENREFWQHQGNGLAMFLSAEGSEHYRLPESFEELTIVAHRFHVKPLLKAVQQDGHYCVLAVSQNNVRFLEGSRAGLSERPVEDLPESMRAIVRGDQDKGFNLHSFRAQANSGSSAVPHGHVESNEEHELKRYFRQIDEALGDVLGDRERPLVFAGVEELFPYFKETTSYKHIIEQPVTGNPDDLSEVDLHDKSWPLVESVFRERQQEAVDRWQAVAHTDLGDTSTKNVVLAAVDGRVDTLLLDAGRQQWGTYDESSRTVTMDDEATAENYDLYDLVAVRTLLASGNVVILEDNGALGENDLAAIFRYPAS